MLVSERRYARNSAFGVTMGEITSVTVNGTDVGYTKSYSTDKASVLDEFSKDWRGQNDVMSWNASAADAVNFRIQIDSNVVIEPADEVVVTFTATVPSYVANTGEENIAWNSFAYAYQNEILGDTVMVAEPAKVGVWVETPDTKIDININKTSDSAGTFYFALFGDEAGTKRISDVVSLILTSDKLTDTVTMQAIDLASMKQQMLDAGMTNADNIYLLETDANGNALSQVASPYTVTYTDNQIPTNTPANSTVNVGVDNKKNTGSITVNKTLAGDKITGDTFYFALFTKDTNNNYIRYEDVPVQPLTFTKAEERSLTFENVPNGVDFYVLETNANGVVADNNGDGVITDADLTSYTSVAGIQYKVTPANVVKLTEEDEKGTCEITNTELVTYSITVSKVLISDKIKTNPKFTVGLFTKNGDDYTLEERTEVASGSEVTFDNLDEDTTYYVFELDGTERLNPGDSFTENVTLNTKDKDANGNLLSEDRKFTVAYDGGGDTEIGFTADDTQKSVVITNSDTTDDTTAKIIVTKTAKSDDQAVSNAKFTVGLFTMNADGKYEQVGGTNIIETGNDGIGTCEFKDHLKVGTPYYVFEMDGDTKRGDGTTVQVDGQTYVVSYPGGNQTLLEAGIPGAVQVVNTHANTPKLTFEKLDANGSPLEVQMFIQTQN